MFWCQVSKVSGESQQVGQLADRSQRDIEKPSQLAPPAFGRAFGEVGGDGDSGASHVAWSPDGRRLLHGGVGGLSLFDLDAMEGTRLVEVDEERYGSEGYHWPQFSPDGNRVAILTRQGDQYGIWILNLADTTLALLTEGAPDVSSTARQFWNGETDLPVPLTWSPADTIYFTGRTATDVWAIAASGGEPRLHVAIPFECYAVAFIPEQDAVFCQEHHSTTDIWQVEAIPPSR